MKKAKKIRDLIILIIIVFLIFGVLYILVNKEAKKVRPGIGMHPSCTQEAMTHNYTFEEYWGNKVSTTEVKQLVSLININNNNFKEMNQIEGIIFINGYKIDSMEFKEETYYIVEPSNGKTVKPTTEDKVAINEVAPDGRFNINKVAGYYSNGYIRNINIIPVDN
ncbi:MAG: hypothetical protein IKG56_00445 [Clostridia bacterium]|nr:hypothetical protein [Clostridia bacterium]